MKNLTITVDDGVLEWARIEAARRGASVSRMVGDFMSEMQRREDAYESLRERIADVEKAEFNHGYEHGVEDALDLIPEGQVEPVEEPEA